MLKATGGPRRLDARWYTLHYPTRDTRAFQTKKEEMEAELRTMVNPVARGSPAGRVRSHVPQPLVNRLGPLATEANVVKPTLSSDVREVGDRSCSPRSILEESTWAERWSTTGGSPGKYEYRNPTYKDATGPKNLTSRSCGGD